MRIGKKKIKFGIQLKMIAMGLAVVAVFLALIMGYILPKTEQNMMQVKELQVKEEINLVFNILEFFQSMEKSGIYNRTEAQGHAQAVIRELQYGNENENYFWITDTLPMVMLHPEKQELTGSIVNDYTDAAGNTPFADSVTICEEQGEGFISFVWPYKGDTNRQETKLAYVKMFEPWGWIIGTGIYTVEVQEAVRVQRNQLMIMGIIIALVASLLVSLFSGRISKNIKKVASTADRLALGDVNQEIKIRSADETADMGNSLGEVVAYFKDIAKAADRIADGDLTVEVTPRSEHDTLGHTFKRMVANLSNLVEQIKSSAKMMEESTMQLADAAEQSGAASTQVANVAQQVAKGSEEQSRNIYEANTAVEQLGQAIDLVIDRMKQQREANKQVDSLINNVTNKAEQTATEAQKAASGAIQASETARDGARTVEKTIEGIGKINLSMQDVSNKITELGTYSEKIGSMIAVIDDIAAQTNLLALNAAIEAARAGEQGRGFAVVADEVKKLAERTAKETKEIERLIGTVQKGVSECVKASQTGYKQTEQGTDLANESGLALNQIMEAVKTVVEQIEHISVAGKEMAEMCEETVKVLASVDTCAVQAAEATSQMVENKSQLADSANEVAGVTEENSAATEEMSASAEEMSSQVQQVVASTHELASVAKELQSAVAKFKVKEETPINDGSDLTSSRNESVVLIGKDNNGNGKEQNIEDYELMNL